MSYPHIVLVTASGTLVGIGLWLAAWYRDRSVGVTPRRLFILIMSVGLICRVACLLLTPIFYAPDEQSHFNYVKYLAENHSLPVQASRTNAPTNDWEYYQPPLYYLALAPFYVLADRLFHREAVTVRILRLFSVLFFCLVVWFAFGFLRGLNITDLFTKTFVISMLSLLPTYTFLSSVMNNDNLLIAIGSGVLYLIVRSEAAARTVLMGILLGLGLLTKLTAVVYLALTALEVLVGFWDRRTVAWPAVRHALLAIALALLIWTPWIWRNWTMYGSITGEETANVLREWKSVLHALWGTLRGVQISFWAVSGIHNNVRLFWPTIGKLVSYLALLGLLYGALLNKKRLILLIGENRNIMVASTLAILMNLALVFRFGLLYGQGQGRFVFPLLIPLSLLMAIGLKMFSASDAKGAHVHVAGFFIVYATSFVSYSLAMFTRTSGG